MWCGRIVKRNFFFRNTIDIRVRKTVSRSLQETFFPTKIACYNENDVESIDRFLLTHLFIFPLTAQIFG
jgi:hypothetical protein